EQTRRVSSGGKVVRMRVNEIRVIGRNTQGVRLIDLDEGERVGAVARLAEREDETDVAEASPVEAPDPDSNGESGAEPDVEPDPEPTEPRRVRRRTAGLAP